MIAYLAARSDQPDYGTLFDFRFPKDSLVVGPQQVEANIDQAPLIKSQFALLNAPGSSVIRGNLLVLPKMNVMLMPKRNVSFTITGTAHGTAYDYDRHVPIIFMGRGIKPGSYASECGPEDIAPTLAKILGFDHPKEFDSRLLLEMLN